MYVKIFIVFYILSSLVFVIVENDVEMFVDVYDVFRYLF